MGKKVRIIVSLLVVAIIGILIIPPQDNSNEVITQVQSDIITSDDNNLDQDIIDEAFQAYSIVDTERVFTESDQSLIERFLDENDLPSSSEKLGIETQIALFDSDNVVYNSSDVFGIPQLSVTDDEGRVLDLGSIQVTFESISKQKETTTDIWGTVEFFLDDTKVDSKYIWASGSNSDRLTLSLLDSLSVTDNIAVAPSFTAQEKKNHTFTLSDKGRDWIDGSEHIYRVVVTKLHANLNSNNDFKEFQWTGQYIAYELKVKVDQSKKIILNEYDEAISVFKNDSTIQVCGSSMNQQGSTSKTPKLGLTTVSLPSVVIKDLDGNVLANVDFTASNASAIDRTTTYKNSCSEKIDGIPRDSDVIFTVDGKDYPVHTPKSQTNYSIDQGLQLVDTGVINNLGNTREASCTVYRNSWHCDYAYEPSIPTSNFGFP